jgi:hypothetical protein
MAAGFLAYEEFAPSILRPLAAEKFFMRRSLWAAVCAATADADCLAD